MHASVIAFLAIAGAVYGAGLTALWRRGRRRSVRPWQAASFVVGWLVVAFALVSPLHDMSETLFSAHMIQHELLMVIAAPLLVLGRPVVVMLWGFPKHVRHALGGASRNRVFRSGWHALSAPFDAWLIHGVAIWIWHIPRLFEASLESEFVHAAQHVTFMGSALLFWWTIIYPARRAARGMSVIYLFTTAVHTGVLGALITMARSPWYTQYADRAAAYGLTPLADQSLAGMVMWIPASLAYLIATLLIVRQWLVDSDVFVNWGQTPIVRIHDVEAAIPSSSTTAVREVQSSA
jgi:cytochrome c oxidase assembly factor CtaG